MDAPQGSALRKNRKTMLDTLTGQLAGFEKEERESERGGLLKFPKSKTTSPPCRRQQQHGQLPREAKRANCDLKNEYQLLDLLNLDQTIERKQPKKAAMTQAPPSQAAILW